MGGARKWVGKSLPASVSQHFFKKSQVVWHTRLRVPLLGKVTYLVLAGRIVMWMSKVPLHAPVEFGEHEEELYEDTREKVDPNDPEAIAYWQQVNAELETRQAEDESMREAARIKIQKEREACRRRARERKRIWRARGSNLQG